MGHNRVDPIYQELINYILRFGVNKQSRNGKIKSVFGFQFRHYMPLGFPLLTTKEMNFKSIVTELLWFLRGDTNIKFLVDNDCNIWNGDAYKFYVSSMERTKAEIQKNIDEGCSPCTQMLNDVVILDKKEFVKQIKENDTFAHTWGDLGPIYGRQWRSWDLTVLDKLDKIYDIQYNHEISQNKYPVSSTNRKHVIQEIKTAYPKQDQILNLINELNTNPDSRRLMVSAWNVHDLDFMLLPPCHYGFQVYTQELSPQERIQALLGDENAINPKPFMLEESWLNENNAPKRSISLMWNQRSVDVPLGLPYNIASYALLLIILGHLTNMVPRELIGNLGDCHIYENQIDPVLAQLERKEFPLPNVLINTNNWYTGTDNDIDKIIQNIQIDDFILKNYQSHPKIKIPLSN